MIDWRTGALTLSPSPAWSRSDSPPPSFTCTLYPTLLSLSSQPIPLSNAVLCHPEQWVVMAGDGSGWRVVGEVVVGLSDRPSVGRRH